MKIGLDFRFVGFGSLVTRRGMGRFTQQQLREVLRYEDGDHEFVLFCREGSDSSEILPEILGDSRVSIRWLPRLRTDGSRPNSPEKFFARESELRAFIAMERLDVFHVCTPFLLGDVVCQSIEVCPYVATHYDLIPLVYRDRYFAGDHGVREYDVYRRGLGLVCRADGITAISQFVRREVSLYLGYPEERARVTYPFAESPFRRVPRGEAELTLKELRDRIGLDCDFVFSLTHFHHSKNLEGLFRAIANARAKSPKARELGLVLACELQPAQQRYVRSVAAQSGLDERVYLTGLVSDDELVALFNACELAVHVSRYEGFGLPALEAMQCGAALVASRAASLPEIVGSAGLLVDPEEPEEIGEAIVRMAGDPDLKAELVQLGLERSEAFNGALLARETLACYRDAVERRARERRRSRISLWTPFPPQESGIAEYSFELVEWLEQYVDVDIVLADGVEPRCPRPLRAVFFDANSQPARWPRPDRTVFEFGGSHFHKFQAEHLDVGPDLLVLHDLTWGRVRWFALRSVPARLEREIRKSEGRRAAQVFRRIASIPPEERDVAAEDFFLENFLLRPMVEASERQLVHFLGGDESLAAAYGSAKADVIIMGVADPLATVPFDSMVCQGSARADGSLTIGVFGIIDPVKRLEVLADAVSTLKAGGVDVLVRVVGAFVSKAYEEDLRRVLHEKGVAEAFSFSGRVSTVDFDLEMTAVDVVCNLRWPFRHQMSATLMRGIAAGKPVVATDLPAWRMVPAEVCYFVPVGDEEVPALVSVLRKLASSADLRQRRGTAARAFYRKYGSIGEMGRAYLRLLEIEVESAPVSPEEWELPRSGLLQADHHRSSGVSWALERLVPDELERAERLRMAGGLAGSLAESALVLALLREAIGSREATVALVGYENWNRLSRCLRTEGVEVLHPAATLEAATPNIGDESGIWVPWETGLADSSAAVAVVGGSIDLASGEEWAAATAEALRIVGETGTVVVCFWYRLAGPGNTGEAWTFDAREVERWLLREPGADAVETFRAIPSRVTLEVPRQFELEREGDERPIRVLDGRVLSRAYVTLRRSAGWTYQPPPERLRSEWLSRRAAEVGTRATEESAERPRAGESGPSHHWDPSDLRHFFYRWDEVRARSGLEEASSGSFAVRASGFLRRTAQRLRDLGIAWDRLRDILVVLVEREVEAHQERSKQRAQMARFEGALSALEARLAALEDAGRVLRVAPEIGGDSDSLSEEAVPFQQRYRPALPSLLEMNFLLRELVEKVPELRTASSIEISFGDSQADDLLELAVRHFGDRIASMAPSGYRAPNDVWVHVDLSTTWPSIALLGNAVARLGDGGVLVLVTCARGKAPLVTGLRWNWTEASRAVLRSTIVCWTVGSRPS
jgi:glycosyltransferase involved in cell wall biosynthesis